jgi:pimeloyl-ACP methyl ester carboxylesterase
LILIHGIADNPYAFDDIAPAFADRFHVVAYARRGSGSSDAKGPFDLTTLTDDLRGVMDALGIAKAVLVGVSAGGDEVTRMAAQHPDRVSRIVYLDAAYDWADPDFHAAYEALPSKLFERPASAMRSLEAFRAYQKAIWYPDLDDRRRIESHLRASVLIRPDGSLEDRTPKEVVNQLYSALFTNPRREYRRIQCPALAIYAEHILDVYATDDRRREEALEYERKYWRPFQSKSIALAQQELARIKVVRVPGKHSSFLLTDRAQLVQLLLEFLSEPLGTHRE